MRLLIFTIFIGAVAACSGPYSGYVEPAAAPRDPPIYGPPTASTTNPADTTIMVPYSVGY